MNKVLLLILILGLVYKVASTSNGQFLFNMDNARDMVDVREMVVLHKLRLIGPTSGIEGFFNGPGWYYLLAIPFVATGGNPYGEVLLMIFLWLIGGYFAMKLAQRWGMLIMILVGILWWSSNYVALSTVYAFNPNPVILLTPLFIFLMEKYLNKPTLTLSVGIWLLAALFFNFEMAYGLFVPIIIFLTIFLSNKKFFRTRNFWLGSIIFLVGLLPQIIFNYRHQMLFLNALTNHLPGVSPDYMNRPEKIFQLYYSVTSATLMNSNLLSGLFIAGFILAVLYAFKVKDRLALILSLLILVPFLGSVILPLNFMPWHLGGAMAAVILMLGFLFFQLINTKLRVIFVITTLLILVYSIFNLELQQFLSPKMSNDPSNFHNEVSAIEWVYEFSQGKNFKVYTYLPSVIDYPSQYLFWWIGKTKYGYLPVDYAYLPNKPNYISNKDRLKLNNNPPDSGLVFLIEDPNRADLLDLWKNSFRGMGLISSNRVGPFTIEVRK